MTFAVTALLSFVAIIAVVGAMGIGILAGREPIKGSCGGLNGNACELCSGKCRRRKAD